MRKILLPVALFGTMSMPFVACDLESGDGDTTDADTSSDTSPDTDTTPPPTTYAAVIIDDSQIFPFHRQVGTDPCATASSPLNAHGADIDAVGLFDGGTNIGYLDTVDYQEGGLCDDKPNGRTNPNEAKGAPDASLTEGFVSLGGGFLAGEFDDSVFIENGYQIVVYEVGSKCGNDDSCGGVDEGYEVFVAEDLNCVSDAEYPYTSCAKKLATEAEGEATIPVSGI